MIPFALLVFTLLAPDLPAADSLPAAPAGRDALRASAPESLGSLLAAPATAGRDPVSGGVFFQLLGWVAALGVVALAAAQVWRRLGARTGRVAEGGALRVLSRAALTPRHFIYAVRLGNQRLLIVGVSGDRIAPLSEFDDPAQVMAMDPTFQKTLDRAGAPDGADRAGGGLDEPDLSPYRREVQRLSELVRGWRGRLGRVAKE